MLPRESPWIAAARGRRRRGPQLALLRCAGRCRAGRGLCGLILPPALQGQGSGGGIERVRGWRRARRAAVQDDRALGGVPCP
jgi:hypothetical protein